MDRLVDPSGDECQLMFTELGTDRQYSRLCRVQKSFRARLSPKPWRIDCSPAPGSHPCTDPELAARFASWLETYERSSRGRAVCAYVGEYGSGPTAAPARFVADLHDRHTLPGDAPLA
jgi:hypothetical protein